MAFVVPTSSRSFFFQSCPTANCRSSPFFVSRKPNNRPHRPSRLDFIASASTSGTTPTPTSTSTSTSTSHSSSSSFDWKNQWYPVYAVVDVIPKRIHTFKLLNESYILYEFSNGHYTACIDQCPHRSAPLSEGRLYKPSSKSSSDDKFILECGYHGWRFNDRGVCVDIPQLPLDGPISARLSASKAACIRKMLPLRVSHGLIFVWPGAGDPCSEERDVVPKDLQEEDADEKGELTLFTPYSRTFDFGFETLVENLTDPAHIPWSHHNVIDKRTHTKRDEDTHLQVVKSHNSESTSKFDAVLIEKNEISLHVSYHAPSLICVRSPCSQAKKFRLVLTFWAVPTTMHTCTLHSLSGFANAPWPLRVYARMQPRWIRCIEGHAVTDGDAAILQMQSGYPFREYGLAYAQWDRLLMAVRLFIDRNTPWEHEGNGRGNNTEMKSRGECLDRYKNHTKECHACASALRNSKVVKEIARVVGIMFGAAILMLLGNGYGAATETQRIGPFLRRYAYVVVASLVTFVMARRVECMLTYWERPHRLSRMD